MSCWVHVIKNKTTDDTGNPASRQNFQFRGIRDVEVTIKIDGTNASWDVTPLYWNDHEDAEQYFDCTTRTITEDTSYILEAGSTQDLFFRCDNSSGTSPEINIWVRQIA